MLSDGVPDQVLSSTASTPPIRLAESCQPVPLLVSDGNRGLKFKKRRTHLLCLALSLSLTTPRLLTIFDFFGFGFLIGPCSQLLPDLIIVFSLLHVSRFSSRHLCTTRGIT